MRTNLTPAQVRDIVWTVSKESYDGNLITNRCDDESNSRTSWTNFTLRVESSRGPGAKVSLSAMPFTGKERRTIAACWHAHRDVMIELFRRYPDAKLRSSMANYNGQADFEAKFMATAYHNIGSQAFPVFAHESCDCALDRVSP